MNFRISGFGFWVQGLWPVAWGLGFGVWGLGFGVWGTGFRVWGLGLGILGLGLGVEGLRLGVWGVGFGMWCMGFGVRGSVAYNSASRNPGVRAPWVAIPSFRVWSLGFEGAEFFGLWLRVQGVACRAVACLYVLTLHPELSTPNPQPCPLNPQPLAPDPKP